MARTYATYRNTIEGMNGYVKDTAHESSAAGRRRVRGVAAQSFFVGLLLMAANFRKIAAYGIWSKPATPTRWWRGPQAPDEHRRIPSASADSYLLI